MARDLPLLALSVGCPAGIGPEVALRAASRTRRVSSRCVLIGDLQMLRERARVCDIDADRLVAMDEVELAAFRGGQRIPVWSGSQALPRRVRPGRPTRAAGAAQLGWIDQALALVRAGVCKALVTGPVSKEAIAGSGAPRSRRFRGHTEHLARALKADEVTMAFWLPGWSTALVTTHLPLRKVARAIQPEGVARACYWLARLQRELGVAQPQLVVAGLNPHAGEGGLLGGEEIAAITPGIRLARRRLRGGGVVAKLHGPIGAESAFRLAAEGRYDGVVAMYHDQATIPCKLLGFGDAVNVTLGLPIIRTSVDHGVAYDVAGRGSASPDGMRAAVELAAKLVHGR